MAANGCGAVMLLLLPLLASSPGSASASVCIFVPGAGVGQEEFLLVGSFPVEDDCALAVLANHPSANGARVHGRPGAKRLCSAVYGMHAIVAHDEQRTCYIYPSSAEKGACDAAPSACTGTYESPDLLLDSAQLTGHVPTQLGRLSATLEALALEGNSISGTLPTELGRLTRLKRLTLEQNSLISGTVPSQLGRLTDLDELALFGNVLSGALPTELGQLNPRFCYIVRAQAHGTFGGDPGVDNAFDCPLPRLSTGCGMNGLSFASRDGHHSSDVCPSVGDLSYHPGFGD